MTLIEIDCAALERNAEFIKRQAGVPVWAMVKADAYGHGAEAAEILAKRCGLLGVSSVEEGIILRRRGITVPILCAGAYIDTFARAAVKNNIALAVYDSAAINALDLAAKAEGGLAAVHLKIDTGMHRLGIEPGRTGEFLRLIETCKNIKLEGIYTHFATADDNTEYLNHQTEVFKSAVSGYNIKSVLLHAANTAAVLKGKRYCFGAVRCGIGLYGYSPVEGFECELEPAMSMVSQVADIRRIDAGEGLGYSLNYTARRDSVIAVAGTGYGDGLPRALSNNWRVFIGDFAAPVVGNICMDLLAVDITDCKAIVRRGDRVVCLSRLNSAGEAARIARTIPYEIITRLTARPKKVYLNN